MIKTTVTLEEVVNLFNTATKADPGAMRALIETRVPCNKELASHPSIQVCEDCTVGLLGLLNGIFGSDEKGWGTLAADFEVVCPNCSAVPEQATVRDKCPHCGVQLVCGKLIEFVDLGKR